VQWADLLRAVSACRELEVLALQTVEIEPLFPPGTAFARLTDLEICDHKQQHLPGAGVMGWWKLVASGGLPALAKLKVTLQGRWTGAEEVESQVAPALEAVAGTVTRLSLAKGECPKAYGSTCVYSDKGDEARDYELGVAVGKLRRLKDLALDLSHNGWAYHALARGLAASGGGRPPPLLWRVRVADVGREQCANPVPRRPWQPRGAKVDSDVCSSADLLAGLLLPSVRVFVSSHKTPREALLTACALRQMGYEHTWAVDCPREVQHAVQAIAQCKLGDAQASGQGVPEW
jgi:hypothetical protein